MYHYLLTKSHVCGHILWGAQFVVSGLCQVQVWLPLLFIVGKLSLTDSLALILHR